MKPTPTPTNSITLRIFALNSSAVPASGLTVAVGSGENTSAGTMVGSAVGSGVPPLLPHNCPTRAHSRRTCRGCWLFPVCSAPIIRLPQTEKLKCKLFTNRIRIRHMNVMITYSNGVTPQTLPQRNWRNISNRSPGRILKSLKNLSTIKTNRLFSSDKPILQKKTTSTFPISDRKNGSTNPSAEISLLPEVSTGVTISPFTSFLKMN